MPKLTAQPNKKGVSAYADTPREQEGGDYLAFFTLEKILPRVSRLFSLSFFEIQ
jgi:hypothetical protein